MLRPQDLISFPIDPNTDLLDIPVPTLVNEHGLTSYQMSYDDILEYEVTREMVAGLIGSLSIRQLKLEGMNDQTLQPAIESIHQTIERLILVRNKISTTDPQGMTKIQDACRPLSKALYEASIATFDEKEVF